MPDISVIIPTFNRKQLLPRAIHSVLTQSFDNFELLIIDDGSTDGTDMIFDIAFDKRIRYHKLAENHGVSYARNFGVDHAQCDLIAFLDSDDEWLNKKLEKQIRFIEKNPELQIIQTCEYWIRNGVKVNPPKTHEKIEGDIFEQSLDRCMITPSSVLLTKELFYKAGKFDENFIACEDYDLWLRITALHRIGLLPEHLLKRYGGHDDQLSKTPVMDTFRIKSLIKLLSSGLLTNSQTELAKDILIKKAQVVANGCRKRGKQKEYEYYCQIAQQFTA